MRTTEELKRRLAVLAAANAAATGWGAALGARHEEINGILAELTARGEQPWE